MSVVNTTSAPGIRKRSTSCPEVHFTSTITALPVCPHEQPHDDDVTEALLNCDAIMNTAHTGHDIHCEGHLHSYFSQLTTNASVCRRTGGIDSRYLQLRSDSEVRVVDGSTSSSKHLSATTNPSSTVWENSVGASSLPVRTDLYRSRGLTL
ncbi:hypothetical protein CBL_07955 [Carabus blaptoides fortunei]